VTSAINPSQVIAVGCALQAYHLAQLTSELPLDAVLQSTSCKTLASPIGIIFPGLPEDGQDQSDVHGILIPGGVRLPCRRRVQFATMPGVTKVAFELWEVTVGVDVRQVDHSNKDTGSEGGDLDDEDDEEDEPEEMRNVVHKRGKLLVAAELPVDNGSSQVVLEAMVDLEGQLSWSIC
jgi:heat shock protein 1/8